MADTKYPDYIKGGGAATGTTTPKRSILQTVAHWIWLVVSIIPTLIINMAELMSKPGTIASQSVGGVIMLTGMLMSADAYWQMWSRQPALFPFYETSWLGFGWVPHPVITLLPFSFRFHLGALFDGRFIFAIFFSSAVQFIQSITFRSQNLKGAKVAGISAKTIGLIAWGSWALDFVLAWGSRNFLAYTNVWDRVGCLTYIVISMFAAELGFIVFSMMRDYKD